VREALAVIERSGVEALSLRDVARRVGVSHQAPYRHFPSRDHLLAEVVRRCFDDLAARLRARPRAGDPHADLAGLGRAYLAHAREHPLAYRLMFGTPLPDPAGHPAMVSAARAAFAVVRDAVAVVVASSRPASDADVDAEAIVVWGKVHGLASLPRVPVISMLELAPGAMAAATDLRTGPAARELDATAP
jgi:AcrR family transcriptional regulator